MTPKGIPLSLKSLCLAAQKSRDHAYSPYSGVKVGAAIRIKGGAIYSGCNVENSSYGGTICAERNAIHSAISREGKIEIKEVFVITDSSPPFPPCGICRQVIAEFGPNSRIHIANLKGNYTTHSLEELLPNAFSPSYLKKNLRIKK